MKINPLNCKKIDGVIYEFIWIIFNHDLFKSIGYPNIYTDDAFLENKKTVKFKKHMLNNIDDKFAEKLSNALKDKIDGDLFNKQYEVSNEGIYSLLNINEMYVDHASTTIGLTVVKEITEDNECYDQVNEFLLKRGWL